ncbi:FHA domain-containing protein [Desulfosporosinus sp. FKA]|uniref:FHA domain-containing protein n=1 Tax=Desulfosporosinus sp. FKA TaxID=1969834 RepID=UPI000B497B3F|nr:FHA domain-containing protein [Desulfosporosinus sp. FKA]
MDLLRCNQGHYFDASVYPSCPFCSGQGPSSGVTQHINNPSPVNDIPKTQHTASNVPNGASDIPVTRALNTNGTPSRGEKTVGIIKAKTGIDPVVGWLVCVEGTSKGQDYQIMSGQNTIGRGQTNISIKGDDSISREKHAVIIYDPKHNRFFIQGGDGRDLIYINDAPVLAVTELHAYDAIEIGKSRLLFIPFCGEEFKWD